MSSYRRGSLGDDAGYVPGEQPPDDGGWLKLNTNESPLPPSAAVGPAVAAAVPLLHRYPNADAEPLRSALARLHGVEPEQVIVGNGGDQLLDCCMRAFCESGDLALWPWPTYSLLPVIARIAGVVPVPLPLEGETRPLPPRALGTEPGRLRFLVNPNAPTGTWLDSAELEALLGEAPGVVVIDEAYGDFAPAGAIPLLPRHPSWLVLRTLSKSHALAGLRVGYAVGSPELIRDLVAVRDSYPVDRLALAAATAAVGDVAHHARIVATVLEQRARLTAALRADGWDVTESHANFIWARPPGGDAVGTQARLRAARILVRHFAGVDPHRLRISVGDASAVDRLLAALAGTAGEVSLSA